MANSEINQKQYHNPTSLTEQSMGKDIGEDSTGCLERIRLLEQQNAALEEALQEARDANQAKSQFLSNMSHDIRTPMNAIVGMVSIALSHIDEKPRVQDCLGKIQTASAHLMSLVNDVLDMSRIDSGRMSLREEAFSLADLVHDISVVVRPQAVQRNHNLQMEIGTILQENLVGDVLRLRQILVNIIGNAVKYTPDGGEIRVRLSQCPVPAEFPMAGSPASIRESLVPGSEPVLLEFQCSDNGIGMSREFLDRIFEPFERVHSAATSKIEGTGLGMSIVKNLVDRMGGRIQVESREGEGSRFDIAIPLATAPQEAKSLNLPTGQTVLVAESLEEPAGQMAAILQDGGLQPLRMQAGLDAVTWLTEAQYENHMPCALLLGQELEDMSVLELARHVRQLAGMDFPILLVSEADWAQIEFQASRAGVNAFVPCPLFQSRLLGTLADLTSHRHQDTGSPEDMEADYSGCHILLVEDNALNQEIALELLSVTGANVQVADDGAQAVELFAASPEGYFDLIFMDVQMPVMDGYEATRQIRAMPRQDARDIWIVAMTANAFVEDIRLSQEAGMNEHFSKPLDPGHLREILHRQLRN